jgi:isopenicillin-N N-acyltransferase like protein
MAHNNSIKKSFFTRTRIFFGILVLLIISFLIFFKIRVTIHPPIPAAIDSLQYVVKKIDSTFSTCHGSWIRKSSSGLWELYTEGDAFERGVAIGELSQPLVQKQESAFIGQIKEMIPSTFFVNFLKYFIAWFNRDLDKYIDKEFQLEIYGISLSASDEFDFIGDKYQRMLNYHAAHDIGHALVEKKMVGCSSFAVWDECSKDSSLIIGRNFDFYVGDEFSENKIICFYHPTHGHNFMMVTWGGMTGVISGMNDRGLTITINAARSEIPMESATPISIVAREILQYSENIEQAFAIAQKRKTFVSESILIGSSHNHKAVIIEKSPSRCALYSSAGSRIICTNHFQSVMFRSDSMNVQQIRESASLYRYKRIDQLLNHYGALTVQDAAGILRDRAGINDSSIGMCNEKSINQLIAHHSIIFKPEKLQVWVSTVPFQIGKYVAYDLNKVFSEYRSLNEDKEITEAALEISADTFLYSKDFSNFKKFREDKKLFQKHTKFSDSQIADFIKTNPDYYDTYRIAGDCLKKSENYQKAIEYYKIALTKEIATFNEKRSIEHSVEYCRKKLK